MPQPWVRNPLRRQHDRGREGAGEGAVGQVSAMSLHKHRAALPVPSPRQRPQHRGEARVLPSKGKLCWRLPHALPPSGLITTPHFYPAPEGCRTGAASHSVSRLALVSQSHNYTIKCYEALNKDKEAGFRGQLKSCFPCQQQLTSPRAPTRPVPNQGTSAPSRAAAPAALPSPAPSHGSVCQHLAAAAVAEPSARPRERVPQGCDLL